MKKLCFSIATLMTAVLCSCSSGGGGSDDPYVPTPEPEKPTTKTLKININPSTGAIAESRATETAFESGDKVGLYVVNRTASGAAGTLAVSGNHADNVCFTYNGTWTSSTPLYWADNTTHADFYLYYPYTASVTSVTTMPFNLKTDQSTEANYKACDLLIGSTANVAPTEQAVNITAKHVMSLIRIIVEAGNGFTSESLAASTVSVKVNGVKTGSTANLSTGAVTATGNTESVTPYNTGSAYQAFIVPQTVGDGNLITITVDGKDYNLSKAFTFKAGTRHTFTVTVRKTSNGVNVDITKWEDDGIDNGGTAE